MLLVLLLLAMRLAMDLYLLLMDPLVLVVLLVEMLLYLAQGTTISLRAAWISLLNIIIYRCS
jgi:hypothetical protein